MNAVTEEIKPLTFRKAFDLWLKYEAPRSRASFRIFALENPKPSKPRGDLNYNEWELLRSLMHNKRNELKVLNISEASWYLRHFCTCSVEALRKRRSGAVLPRDP